jgi:hypothetical protein
MRKEYFCNGIGEIVFCQEVDNVLILDKPTPWLLNKLGKEYKDWKIEKIGFGKDDYKFYVQLRFQHLIKTMVL